LELFDITEAKKPTKIHKQVAKAKSLDEAIQAASLVLQETGTVTLDSAKTLVFDMYQYAGITGRTPFLEKVEDDASLVDISPPEEPVLAFYVPSNYSRPSKETEITKDIVDFIIGTS
jgi:hypothetical protein